MAVEERQGNSQDSRMMAVLIVMVGVAILLEQIGVDEDEEVGEAVCRVDKGWWMLGGKGCQERAR